MNDYHRTVGQLSQDQSGAADSTGLILQLRLPTFISPPARETTQSASQQKKHGLLCRLKDATKQKTRRVRLWLSMRLASHPVLDIGDMNLQDTEVAEARAHTSPTHWPRTAGNHLEGTPISSIRIMIRWPEAPYHIRQHPPPPPRMGHPQVNLQDPMMVEARVHTSPTHWSRAADNHLKGTSISLIRIVTRWLEAS